MTSINLSATGSGVITYGDDAMLPAGISLTAGVVSGTPTASTEFSTSVTFTATDSNGNTEDLFVSFPAINASGGGVETVNFTTAETLPSTSAGQSINETVVATGSQGSMPTYSFISASNTGNAFGLSGTTITVTGNQISGIAPRLLNAATYSFEIQASIQAGTVTNNRTFTLLISQDATCISPINNICT